MMPGIDHHASDAALIRLVDEEPVRDEQLAAHVATCAACTQRMDEARRRSHAVASFLSAADEPYDAARFRATRDALRVRQVAARRWWKRPAWQAAAGVALFTGLAAASPVRSWVARQIDRLTTPSVIIPDTAATAPTVLTVPIPPVAGIGLPLPASAEVAVSIDDARGPVSIRLRLTDEPALSVRGVGGAANAEFQTRVGAIGIRGANGGELQIDVPRAARSFVLRVGGVTYAVKEGLRIRVLMASVDTVGAELLLSINP